MDEKIKKQIRDKKEEIIEAVLNADKEAWVDNQTHHVAVVEHENGKIDILSEYIPDEMEECYYPVFCINYAAYDTVRESFPNYEEAIDYLVGLMDADTKEAYFDRYEDGEEGDLADDLEWIEENLPTLWSDCAISLWYDMEGEKLKEAKKVYDKFCEKYGI